jgi:hypothetical protein
MSAVRDCRAYREANPRWSYWHANLVIIVEHRNQKCTRTRAFYYALLQLPETIATFRSTIADQRQNQCGCAD